MPVVISSEQFDRRRYNYGTLALSRMILVDTFVCSIMTVDTFVCIMTVDTFVCSIMTTDTFVVVS